MIGAGTRRVWAANAGTASAISVINPDTNTSVGTIDLPAPALDIAFSPDGTRAYAVNLNANNIAVIDTATSSVVGNITVTDPVRAKVGADGTRLYVTNGSTGVSVFNTQTLALVTDVAVGESPDGLAVAPNGKRVYVANRNSDSVSVIDTGIEHGRRDGECRFLPGRSRAIAERQAALRRELLRQQRVGDRHGDQHGRDDGGRRPRTAGHRAHAGRGTGVCPQLR